MVLNWVYAKCSVTSLILLTFSSINDATQQDCKFTLLQDSGTFQTPNFPVKYPNDIECVWNIQVQPGRFILLSFDVVELESYRGECIDLVEVKDGSRPTDQLLGSFCDISIVPKVITSSSNTLRIWFYSDKSFANQGFNGSYSSQREKGCGGALTKHSQSISSPRYPDYPYPNSLQCDWVITMPRGKFIRLEFFDFEVEFKCDGKCWCADQLEIWEGPEFNETKLGSFCVSVQELLVSKNNRMRIRFTTNKEGRFKGFLLSYTSSITPGCGGDLTGQSGNITSPYYPMSFPAFSDCVWRVKVPTDRYISLRFLVFTGINGANSECSLDSIEVRDGYSSEASLIDRYCIQNIPPVIVSSGYELYIYFRARSNDEGTPHLNRKFQGSYLTHSYECHESIGLQDGRVRNSQISASSYFTLQLGQGQLHLRPQYGRVGSDYSWCSQTQVLNKIVGEYLQIDLLNYTEITAVATQGYQLHGTDYRGLVSSYKVEYSYDGNRWIAYVDSTKNSTSQGYREFKGNTDFNRVKKNIFMPSIVAKIIRIVPIAYKSYPVKHMCVRAELYGCPYDFGCGSIVSLQKPGSIAVRGSNQQSKKCTWLSIPSTPSSSNDVITFQFSYFYVPCHHGHVMLHARGDGGKMNTFCGVDPPPVSSLPASTQITLEIKLKKGSPVWGFDLHHKTEYLGCGRIVQVLSNGTMTSPNHPLSYDNNQDCTWILSTNPGSKIKLNFLEFELQPPNQTQCLDFVQVQEGRLDTSTVLGKFCGTSAPVPVISTSNHLRVSFHSDGTTKQKGFLLEYSLVSLKEPESPSPPDYPGRTENTETNPGGATTEHHPNSGRSVDVTTCLVHITMLTCLTLVVY